MKILLNQIKEVGDYNDWDKQTETNTRINIKVPKVDNSPAKAKSSKNLQLNLDRNVTCEFTKFQIVNELLADPVDKRL
jgi:hypothetical protein